MMSAPLEGWIGLEKEKRIKNYELRIYDNNDNNNKKNNEKTIERTTNIREWTRARA